ncbi:phosphatidylinositol-specific phospholipase C1-like protein [Algoriphagus sp. H41]|uniref:Phosphatidylinositol-specific phospholipase C1-like protein n=1 Tax=Algoriphagus oliviformis TaxID=2811231 RepID=A0ABS3C608_9BACT|nr:phosphatidylinositol-specific phospholipase C1-like protein [Algoriphagus oliviformis]MBN7812558.1 phosphatidylinositol-specific phospholipase C1-like protein [Algoriphagus oliviformis]
MKTTLSLAILALCLASPLSLSAQDLKLNQIQVIGSHNSYKSQMAPELLDYLSKINPAASQSLAYAHIPLESQLDLGLRNLELDVFHDPQGGRYSNPKGLEIIQSAGGKLPDYDPSDALAKAGLKLFHVQDLDFQSHYLLFADALAALKKWSDAQPDHTPIFVLINAKDSQVPGTRSTLPFTASALDSIDLEIRTHLGMDKLITPDLVRGEFASLEAAVLAGNWPSLDEVRGRFLFVLDENEEKTERYLSAKPDLRDAVLFVNKKEGNPNAGFRIINNAVKDEEYIRDLVGKGYLIRTRADSDTKEARAEDYGTFEKAKASGAQVISTDYYQPSTFFESSYRVDFGEGGYERPNPVLVKNNMIIRNLTSKRF